MLRRSGRGSCAGCRRGNVHDVAGADGVAFTAVEPRAEPIRRVAVVRRPAIVPPSTSVPSPLWTMTMSMIGVVLFGVAVGVAIQHARSDGSLELGQRLARRMIVSDVLRERRRRVALADRSLSTAQIPADRRPTPEPPTKSQRAPRQSVSWSSPSSLAPDVLHRETEQHDADADGRAPGLRRDRVADERGRRDDEQQRRPRIAGDAKRTLGVAVASAAARTRTRRRARRRSSRRTPRR